jgi:hypothetical protein
MMPVWRLQTAIWADTTLPRDAMVITPHFDDHGALTDPEGLATDLANAISDWMEPVDGRQIQVKAYDAQGAVPVVPQADVIINAGLAAASPWPREVAVCLSYFSGDKRPRNRGRLYIPPVYVSALATPSARPATGQRSKVGELAPIFANLGGADVDWVVFSRRDNAAKPVTGWWVDDEWDVVRSRGLRPTTRLEGSLSE